MCHDGTICAGHIGASNNTNKEQTIDLLYIGQANNGSGHWLFKLDTKQAVSVNRITIVPMSDDFQQRVNKLGGTRWRARWYSHKQCKKKFNYPGPCRGR